MIQDQFSFEEFGFSSKIIRDLVANKDTVQPFFETPFSLDNLASQARNKTFSNAQREELWKALQNQNAKLTLSAVTGDNIKALKKEKTVTITTGHQLNLLTGPLYSIYKVSQVIGLCQEMNERDDEYHYVPVFWMATEDHDFDEINHINLFGNKIEWIKEGQDKRICGEIEPVGIETFIDPILDKYKDEELKEKLKSFTSVYQNAPNLAEATRQIMNSLFSDYGLVIIDGNDPLLKKAFVPVALKEVEEGFVYREVSATNAELEKAGYHNQVYVRNCNLFYIDETGKRLRISKEEERFSIDDQEIAREDLLKMINEHPEQFSPNALLRPVYQELVLPNISYVGGGGEIAYWLQLYKVFQALDLNFPLLRVRDSLLLLREKEIQDLEALQLSVPDLKRDLQAIVKEIALEDVTVEIQLNAELEQLREIKSQLLLKAESVNKGMGGMIEAEFSKMEKSIERIESKLIKAEKGKHEQKANKIKRLQHKIYPGGGFQERYENFIPYFLNDNSFVSKIVDNLKAADEPKISIIQI